MFNIAEFEKRRTGLFGHPAYYFESVDSTNPVAETLARKNAGEGTIVIANQQSKGRGRKANSWFSPPDCNLYFSMVLRPDSSQLIYLPYLAGLSVIHVLKDLGLKADLKWPNDIMVNEKKICGILIETANEENRLQHAIFGCGINVNVVDFPDELKASATSIGIEKGVAVARESLLAEFLLDFERRYGRIDRTPWSVLCHELENHSTYLQGCEVEFRERDHIVQGITEGLDQFGGLILRTTEGTRVFYAGEVQSCRKR